MNYLKEFIENIFNNRHKIIEKKHFNVEIENAIDSVVNKLNSGEIRVSEKIDKIWITHHWIKKAIFLSFLFKKNHLIHGYESNYFDKLDLKFFNYDYNQFDNDMIRVVPPASVRKGAFIAKNTVLMPSYINIGAYIDEGCMIDTWSTIGSCAQIGKNVHISGGVGIGGVLEPIQSNPTIIEDNCFIGARSEIAEGVIVREGSVISMGVYIGMSTKIFDRKLNIYFYGEVPPYSVVVPGSLPSKDGTCNLYCAVIVKKVDDKTKKKVKVNKFLRKII